MPRVLLDAQADADLAAIAEYIGIEQNSPQAAARLIDEFQRKCVSYSHQPNMGDPREDLGRGLRSFPFKRNYVVIYRPLIDGIYVLRVFHAIRDYPRLFRNEFTDRGENPA